MAFSREKFFGVLILGLFVVPLSAAAIYVLWQRGNAQSQGVVRPVEATRPSERVPEKLVRKTSAPPVRGSNSDTCAECHSDIVKQYASSGMSRSWRASRNLNVPYQDAVVRDPDGGYEYRLIAEDGHLLVEETIGSKGYEAHCLLAPVDHVVGSGNHAHALAYQNGDAVHMLPIAWFSAEQQWKFTPGYEGNNLRFSRSVTEQCVACHATSAKLQPPTLNHFPGGIVEGIGCERCHGDSDEHVKKWRDGQSAESTSQADSIINPADLAADRANDVCFQCHLQGMVSLLQPGKNAFSFQPGDRLSDHRLDFLAETDNPSAFGVAAHGARMMQSPCFTASAGKLTCIHCHDPHEPVAKVSRATFDRKCLNCHETESCSRERSQETKSTEQSCTACHMAQRGTHEGQHIVFTDHWIQRDPGKFEPEMPIIEADSDVKLIPIWPDADPNEIRLASTYIWLHEAIGPQRLALDRGIEMLKRSRAKKQTDPDAELWLAKGLVAKQQPRDAINVLEGIVTSDQADPRSKWMLGIASWRIGDLDRAIRLLNDCIEQHPYWTEPYEQLAYIYLERQRYSEAVDILRRQLKQRESPQALVNLTVALEQAKASDEEVKQLLERALQLDPRFVPARLNLGWLHARREEWAAAAESYRAVLRLDPRNVQATEALRMIEGR